MNRLILFLGVIGFLAISCDTQINGDNSTQDLRDESQSLQSDEIKSEFAQAITYGGLDFQMDSETQNHFRKEFVKVLSLDLDSAEAYSNLFIELVNEGFEFNIGKDLQSMEVDLSELKGLNSKYKDLGFDGFCDFYNEWQLLFGKPDEERALIDKLGLSKKELDDDYIIGSVKFSQACRTKLHKREQGR